MLGIRSSGLWNGGWVGAAAVALMASSACGGETTDGSSSPACVAPASCGGDITGLWHVTSMCANYSQSFFESVGGGTTLPSECTASLGRARSQFTPIDATIDFQNGQYVEAGTVQEELWATFDAACLNALQIPDAGTFCSRLQTQYQATFDSATCTTVGGGCECVVSRTAPFDQTGGYSVQGNDLIFTSGSAPNPFCVKGNTASLSISSSGLTATMGLSR